MDAVNINGGSNSIAIFTTGPQSPGETGCTIIWSMQGVPQSCPFTITTSGSGGRTASVSITISEQPYPGVPGWTSLNVIVNNISKGNSPDWSGPYYDMDYSLSWYYLEDAIQAQAQVRLLRYQGLETLITGFDNLSSQCLNAYHQYTNGNSVPVEIIGGEIDSLFGALGEAALDFAWADVLDNCGSLQLVWNVAEYGGSPGTSLLGVLGSMAGSVQSEVNDLSGPSYNVGYNYNSGALTDLANQATYASNSGATNTIQYWDQQMINALNNVISDNLYCFTIHGNIPCAPYAQEFINDVFQPLANYIAQDENYIQGVQQTLQNDAGTLTASWPAGNAEVGVPYSSSMSSSGGLPPPNFWISLGSGGSLPSGLSLSPGSTATISGTPTTSQWSSFQVQVTDGASDRNWVWPSINVAPHVQVATSNLPIADVNGGYSNSLSASNGYGPYSWQVASGSSLPAGLSLSSSGVVSGTPSSVGNYTFTVKVIDSFGGTALGAVKLEVVNWQHLSASASPIDLGYWVRIVCYPNPNGGKTCVPVTYNYGDTSTVTAYYTFDGTGKAVIVTISASQGSLSSTSCTTTNGSCSVTLTDSIAGTSTATISYGGVRATATVDYCSSSSPC